MHTYKIKYTDEEGEHFENTEGCDAGNAFAKCQKLHPNARMLEALRSGSGGWTDYVPPPVQRNAIREPRPFRAPKRDEKDGVMPFYDEVVSK